jgi:hypothetical protein
MHHKEKGEMTTDISDRTKNICTKAKKLEHRINPMLEFHNKHPQREVAAKKSGSSSVCGIDTDPFFILTEIFVLHDAIYRGEQGIITTAADIGPRVYFGAELTDQNTPRRDFLPAEPFDPTPLTSTVTTVSGTATCFLMSHFLLLISRSDESPGYFLHFLKKILGCNRFDFQCGIRLTVPLLEPVTFTPLLLEDDDFLRSALFGYFCHDLGTLENRPADLHLVAINNHQHIAQVDCVAYISFQFFDPQLVSTCYLILFSASPNYCIHY